MPASKHLSVRPRPLRIFRIVRSVLPGTDGGRLYYLDAGSWRYRCSIGRAGTTHRKREGDGCTPIGRFAILSWRFRPCGAVRSRPRAPWQFIHKDDGWCDDPQSGSYNRAIKLPARLGHERMWRSDNKYDAVGIMAYNIKPRVSRLGSAIFVHLCSDKFESTAGCVALNIQDMRKVLSRTARHTSLVIV